MNSMYTLAEDMAELYGLLEDERSKDIFWARLRFDCEASLENDTRLYCLLDEDLISEEELAFRRDFPSISRQLKEDGKKLFLYGTGFAGQRIGEMLLTAGDFDAFCTRNPQRYPDGLLGKPVYSPDYVFEHPDECYVVISCMYAVAEIYQILMEHNFPKDHIFIFTSPTFTAKRDQRQYFDFPSLFPKGTAFVDAGCFDCSTSIRFATWCHDEYSKILAFEPDPKSYQQCLDIADNSSRRLELYPFGLSDREGEIHFIATGDVGSNSVPTEESCGEYNTTIGQRKGDFITIKTVLLDNIAKDTTIGFIKMDIEGAEMDALRGAEKIIQRDRPLMALSVYHRRGDVLAIMDYLHKLVPQYRFWLRHYSNHTGYDTVLYASVTRPE